MAERARRPAAPADALARLRAMAPLAGLAEPSFAALCRRLRYEILPAGALLIDQGSRTSAVYFVTRGETVVVKVGEHVTVDEGPTIAGLLSALDGSPRTASIEAVDDVEAFRLAGPDLDRLLASDAEFASALLGHLAGEVRALEAEEERQLTASAVPEDGPAEQMLLVVEAEPTQLRDLLADGVHSVPGAGGRYLLVLSFSKGHAEATPLLPCLGPGLAPALFCPERYADDLARLVRERELQALPVRPGRVDRRDGGADLFAGATLTVRFRHQDARPVPAGEYWPALVSALLGASTSITSAVVPLLRGRERGGGAIPLLSCRRLRGDRVLYQTPLALEGVEGHALLAGPALQRVGEWPLHGTCLAAFAHRATVRLGRPTPVR